MIRERGHLRPMHVPNYKQHGNFGAKFNNIPRKFENMARKPPFSHRNYPMNPFTMIAPRIPALSNEMMISLSKLLVEKQDHPIGMSVNTNDYMSEISESDVSTQAHPPSYKNATSKDHVIGNTFEYFYTTCMYQDQEFEESVDKMLGNTPRHHTTFFDDYKKPNGTLGGLQNEPLFGSFMRRRHRIRSLRDENMPNDSWMFNAFTNVDMQEKMKQGFELPGAWAYDVQEHGHMTSIDDTPTLQAVPPTPQKRPRQKKTTFARHGISLNNIYNKMYKS